MYLDQPNSFSRILGVYWSHRVRIYCCCTRETFLDFFSHYTHLTRENKEGIAKILIFAKVTSCTALLYFLLSTMEHSLISTVSTFCNEYGDTPLLSVQTNCPIVRYATSPNHIHSFTNVHVQVHHRTDLAKMDGKEITLTRQITLDRLVCFLNSQGRI